MTIIQEYIKEAIELTKDEDFMREYNAEVELRESCIRVGREKEKLEIASAMLKDGLEIELIEKYTGLSEIEINELE